MPVLIDSELRLRLSTTEALIPSVVEDMGNPAWERAASHVLIVRLSPFKDVEDSSSHLVLFAECRRALPDAFIDLAFFPDSRERAMLGSRKLPFYYGLQSGRGAMDFDLVLVSNAFALELINLGYLYASSGPPSRASARAAAAAAGEPVPIVILGGSNAAASGALLFNGTEKEVSSDCLVDGIFFGEGESGTHAGGGIGELASALTKASASRAELLEGASSIEGLWRALSGKTASRKTLRPYPPHLTSYPVLNFEGAATARLQISAGCPGFCSFCLEGWESRPYREMPLEEISEAARELKARTGASGLDVYSYNFNTHADIFDLFFELNRIFRRVNFMSQRLDALADSPALARAELAADKRSFTLGIEGISERMRLYYRKGIDAAQIDAALECLSLPAVRELKLFYIIAGIEDDRDIAEFAEFAARASEMRRGRAPGQRIIVSAGYLARLPFTPLQYAPLRLDRVGLQSIAESMGAACAASGLEFRLASDFEEYYVDQLLALGGRALAPWLERTPEAGLAYDGGISRGVGASLEAFAAKAGLLDAAFIGEKPDDWRPPLAFIDENHAALRRTYLLASSFATKEGRILAPSTAMPSTAAPKTPSADWEARLKRLMVAKRGFASTLVKVEMPISLAGATAEYRSSWLMRRISAASPEGGASVFDAEEALFSKGGRLEGMAGRFCGVAYFNLRGPDSGKMMRAASAAGFVPTEALPSCEYIQAITESPAAFGLDAEASFRAWLARERISYIEERKDASRLLRPSARDAKKRILLEAELFPSDPGGKDAFRTKLALGRKARLEDWLSSMSPAAARSTSIRFISY